MSFLRASANFLFPSIMDYFAAKASQDKFESQIYRSALVGSLVGFFVGFMTTVALVTAGLLGSFPLLNSLVGASLLTYGLPLFIGIPWLFSIIGRGLGFVHGLNHTVRDHTTPSYIKPNNIAVTACLFAVTGDAFVKEFYTHFYQLNTLHRTNFLRRMNEIGCLNRAVRPINFDCSVLATEYSENFLSELHRIGFIDNSVAGQNHLGFIFGFFRPSWIKPTIDLMRQHGLLTRENLEFLYQHRDSDDNLYAALNILTSGKLLSNSIDDPDYAQKNFRAIVQATSNRIELAKNLITLHNEKSLWDEVRNSIVKNPKILEEQKPIRSNVSMSFSAPKNFVEDLKENKDLKSTEGTLEPSSLPDSKIEDSKNLTPVSNPLLQKPPTDKPINNLQAALTQLSEHKISTSENRELLMEISDNKQNFSLTSNVLVRLHEAGILDNYRELLRKPPQHVEDIADGLLSLHQAGILNPQNAALLVKDLDDGLRPPTVLRTAEALIKLHKINLLEENRDFLSQSKINTAEWLSNALIKLHTQGIPITQQIRPLLYPNLIPFMIELHKANILEENMKFMTAHVQNLIGLPGWCIENLSKALQEFHSDHINIDDRLRSLLIQDFSNIQETVQAFIQLHRDGILPQHYNLIPNRIGVIESLMDLLNELKACEVGTEDSCNFIVDYLKKCSGILPRDIQKIAMHVNRFHDLGILRDYLPVIQQNIAYADNLFLSIKALHDAHLLNTDKVLKKKTDHPFIKYILEKPGESRDRTEIIKILQNTPYLNKFLERSAEVPARPAQYYLKKLKAYRLLQSKQGEANALYVAKDLRRFRSASKSSVVFQALDTLNKAGLLTKENAQYHFDTLFMWETRGYNINIVIYRLASWKGVNHLNSENLNLVYKNARYINHVDNAFSSLDQRSCERAFDPRRSSEENVRNRVKAILAKADVVHHIEEMIESSHERLKDATHLMNEKNLSSFIVQALQKPPLIKKTASAGEQMEALLAGTQTPKDSKINPSALRLFGRGVFRDPAPDFHPFTFIKEFLQEDENIDVSLKTPPTSGRS